MDMKLGDDIYESFRAYQRALLKEHGSMADEFGFRVLDARRKVDVIRTSSAARSPRSSPSRIRGRPGGVARWAVN